MATSIPTGETGHPPTPPSAAGQKKPAFARFCLFSCLGCGGLGLVAALLLAFLLQLMAKAPMVADDYHKRVHASLALEKRYTAFGPQEVKAIESESQQSLFKHYKVWYPSDLEARSGKPYPIVVFANGSGAVYSKYEPIFRHLASWGFVAVGNDDPSSGSGASTVLTLDYILSLNKEPQSVFYRKLDATRIGVTGHSQGGTGAVHAVTHFEQGKRFTSLCTASNVSSSANGSETSSGWSYDTAKVRIPYFMVAGTGQMDANALAPLASLVNGFDQLPGKAPAVLARRRNVDHGETLKQADGYMTAWFRYTLMKDTEAGRVFAGKAPEILANTANWQDVRIKGID